jgi:hypothetical protein
MNGWLTGWLDGWMDGWMDESTYIHAEAYLHMQKNMRG